jgi:hypothetical protein
MDNNEPRFCDYFDMTPQQFHDYKASKLTRLAWYVVGMVFVTIFNDRLFGYVFLTLLLIASYWYDGMRERQWIKDGAIKTKDLR